MLILKVKDDQFVFLPWYPLTHIEGDLEKARKHFIYANMADEFGKVLVELSHLGHPEETQMFIAQAVLQWVNLW